MNVRSSLWTEFSTGLTVTRGQNVTLDCPLQTNHTVGIVSWYKQNAGKELLMILSYPVNSTSVVQYGGSFQARKWQAVVNRENDSTAPPQLLIRTAEENDSATYYCSYSDHHKESVKFQP
ncbi:T cell receptor alpha variable 19 isoform X2 [Denticeps clupeoides]|uniref:T cell receptor alpha variable 19 isoform X2 n=1 Tax=Denticeps clupeoides TaxID=299321 RepID=UPI003EB936A1